MAQQTAKDKMWVDEKGTQIPYTRTTRIERMQERHAATLLNDAMKVNKQLQEFKVKMRKICDEVYSEFMKSKEIMKKPKGNYTWHNFDRTIKVEVSIQDRIEFDDITIQASKEKLDQFISENVHSEVEFMNEMVTDAFSTSTGKLDPKKVFNLLRWKSKIKVKLFQEAMELIEQSIRRPDSRTYFRIWLKNEDGKYENIELNFSQI